MLLYVINLFFQSSTNLARHLLCLFVSCFHFFFPQTIVKTPLYCSTETVKFCGLMIKFVQLLKVLSKSFLRLAHVENPFTSFALGHCLDHTIHTRLTHLVISSFFQNEVERVCDCEFVKYP